MEIAIALLASKHGGPSRRLLANRGHIDGDLGRRSLVTYELAIQGWIVALDLYSDEIGRN